ncbi:MAG TPA: phosphatase PAP2 family protein [Anaerolineae bacterium]
MKPNTTLKRTTLLPGLVLCGLVLLLAVIVNARLLQSIDLQVTLFLQSVLPRSLDLPSSLLSLAGSAEVTVPVFAILVLLSRPEIRIKLVLLFALLTLLEVGGKHLINQLEPPDELVRYLFRFGTPTGRISTPFSYPSGHAARTSFLAVLAIALIVQSRARPATRRILIAVVLVTAVAMLVSRVYIGDHWSTDVIGGALLGAGLCLCARLTDSERESRIRSVGGAP